MTTININGINTYLIGLEYNGYEFKADIEYKDTYTDCFKYYSKKDLRGDKMILHPIIPIYLCCNCYNLSDGMSHNYENNSKPTCNICNSVNLLKANEN